MPRALLSVSDKTGLVQLARALAARQYEIVSTGGTARTLIDAGIAVVQVSDVTGMPEMLDGRVKTLHPAVHGGVLARRRSDDDMATLARLKIAPIDLVAVNLYPFRQAAADPHTSFDELIEQIDIGGPTLVRASAKNFADVVVVVDPDDYDEVIRQLDAPGGAPQPFRFALAQKAFAHTAAYDTAIASTLATVGWVGDPSPSSGAGPSTGLGAGRFVRQRHADWWANPNVTLALHKVRDLRYGENPHQRAAWFQVEGQRADVVVRQGKELSFTNLLDLDAAARIVAEFEEPAAVVVKHANPCGAAVGPTLAEAYVRAREADAVSAFGGIVGLNRALDDGVARQIVSTFIEAVIAPEVTEDAAAILAQKPNMRVVIAPGERATSPLDLRSIFAGVLVEDQDRVAEASAPWPPEPGTGIDLHVVTKRTPTAAEWVALRFAWRLIAHVKSNAIVFTTTDRTVAIGAGQTSRVDAVRLAALKAGDRSLAGSVAASDAFFPFRDGLDAVADAGATAVVQPGGSARDAEVVAAADERGLAMVFTGRRHFRH